MFNKSQRIRSDNTKMLKKISIPTVIAIFLLSSVAVWGLAPGNPDIFVQVSPASQDVSTGGSGAFTVSVISQEGFEDDVQLSVADPPAGVTVTFDPNPVAVPAFAQGDVQMTVTASADASIGTVTLTITAQGVTETTIEQTKDVAVNLVAGDGQPPPPEPPPDGNQQNGGTPSTVTTTTTITTTVVQSTVLTESVITTATVTTSITQGPPQDPTLANATLGIVALAAIVLIVAAGLSIAKRK
jgi:hypothetical protein